MFARHPVATVALALSGIRRAAWAGRDRGHKQRGRRGTARTHGKRTGWLGGRVGVARGRSSVIDQAKRTSQREADSADRGCRTKSRAECADNKSPAHGATEARRKHWPSTTNSPLRDFYAPSGKQCFGLLPHNSPESRGGFHSHDTDTELLGPGRVGTAEPLSPSVKGAWLYIRLKT